LDRLCVHLNRPNLYLVFIGKFNYSNIPTFYVGLTLFYDFCCYMLRSVNV